MDINRYWLYFDIVVGFLVRTVVRFVKMRSSETWPVEKGTISSATCPLAAYGGPVAELGYTYIHKGEYYSGVHPKELCEGLSRKLCFSNSHW